MGLLIVLMILNWLLDWLLGVSKNASMVELEDTSDLGSDAFEAWEFESP